MKGRHTEALSGSHPDAPTAPHISTTHVSDETNTRPTQHSDAHWHTTQPHHTTTNDNGWGRNDSSEQVEDKQHHTTPLSHSCIRYSKLLLHLTHQRHQWMTARPGNEETVGVRA